MHATTSAPESAAHLRHRSASIKRRQFRYAQLFGAQPAFRQRVDSLQPVHRAQIVAQCFALMPEAMLRELEKGRQSAIPKSAAASRGVSRTTALSTFGGGRKASRKPETATPRARASAPAHSDIRNHDVPGTAAMRSATSACTRNTARSHAPCKREHLFQNRRRDVVRQVPSDHWTLRQPPQIRLQNVALDQFQVPLRNRSKKLLPQIVDQNRVDLDRNDPSARASSGSVNAPLPGPISMTAGVRFAASCIGDAIQNRFAGQEMLPEAAAQRLPSHVDTAGVEPQPQFRHHGLAKTGGRCEIRKH